MSSIAFSFPLTFNFPSSAIPVSRQTHFICKNSVSSVKKIKSFLTWNFYRTQVSKEIINFQCLLRSRKFQFLTFQSKNAT
jgi:hypothetical protein